MNRAGRFRELWVGAAGSLVLLVAVIGIEAGYPWILKVPAQWIAIAALPALIALIRVGLIDEFSFGGVGFKREIKDLGFFPRSKEFPPMKQSAAAKAFESLRAQGGSVEIRAASEVPGWSAPEERERSYQRAHSLEMVHIYKPSTLWDQAYDVSVYLMKHIPGRENDNQTTGFTDIDHAEFFFGPSWGDQIFVAQNRGLTIGVNTVARGQFLAICRVVFSDGTAPVLLHRYIDYEMLR